MRAFFQQADAVLRGTARDENTTQYSALLWRRAATGVLFGLAYGAAMGCFGGISDEHLLQVFYSAMKVPLLLVVSFALALPSFLVLNTLLGVREDFIEALRALIEAQTGGAIVLASLAPFTLLFYASSSSYEAAVLFNFVMFALASAGAQLLLRRRYRVLVARREMHRKLLWGWLFAYGFIATQMGWILRPFVGAPDAPVRFFREGAWGNVYEVLLAMLWKVLS